MSLSRKRVGFIIVLIMLSLSGLIVLQSYLLSYAFRIKEQAFRRNVMAALNSAVQKLEVGEVTRKIFRPRGILDLSESNNQWVQVDVNTTIRDSVPQAKATWIEGSSLKPGQMKIQNDSLVFQIITPMHVTLQAYYPKNERNVTLLDSFMVMGEYVIGIKDADKQPDAILYRLKTDSTTMVFIYGGSFGDVVFPEPDRPKEKIGLVTAVVDRLTSDEWLPVEQRLDSARIDSVLMQSLTEAGIELEPAWGVVHDSTDSVNFISPASFMTQIKSSELKTPLFPHDFIASRADLAVFFPGRQAFLWRQVGPLFLATGGFMLIIILCFIYTIYTIISQKRFAGRLVSFINNMTHEFKTPISTVALASEAIQRPEVITNSEKVARYNTMIQSENRRMRGQVEKILQMAVLEEGDYDLNLEQVDLHTVINRAVANIAIQIENRQGSIICDLQAENPVINADTLHLENIIHNLLDNANKYSREKPDIRITTRSFNNRIIVSVEDHGIGISEKDRRMVFEKYYRVDSGNIHDVKGFGLGLSYVRLMVEAHHGTIELKSEKGIGTTVEITFPLANAPGGTE